MDFYIKNPDNPMDGMEPRLKDKLTVGASSQWAAWFASLAPAAFVEKSNWVISCFELPPGWRYFSCGKYGKMLIIWWLFNFNRAWWLSKSGWNGLSANVQTNLRICGVFKTSRYMFPPFKDSSANQNPGTSSKQNIGSWPIIYFMGIWRADDCTKDNIIYPTKSNLIGRVPRRGC